MKITVVKSELLDALQANRQTHVELFQKAIEKYREKAVVHFNEQIDIVKSGGEVERVLRLPVPEEHTDDFDRAIEMVQWHNDDTMVLDEHQFENFIRNRWDWHRAFMANTTSYLET